MTVLDRVPVDRITVEARQLRIGRSLLALLAGLFYVLGWSAARVFTAVAAAVRAAWFGVSWCVAAVKVGWSDARAAR